MYGNYTASITCKGEAQKGHREGRGATLAALRWSVAYRNNFARS